ncbi:Gfo/Idh/MocA family protein [Bacteroidota bacterium]
MHDKLLLNTIDRRNFLKKSALSAGAVLMPGFVGGTSITLPSPAGRINIAIIGVAGRGQKAVIESMSQNVVALCDVDKSRVEKCNSNKQGISKQFNAAVTMHEKNGAKWFSDYRIMFEELKDKIDAVIISTPDHMHFPIALSAINFGKHVYCETPLTHTVEEAKILAQAAKDKGIITQMGNQGHSNIGTSQIREWIQAGIFGEIREVHSWTSRSAIWWKNCVPNPGYYRSNNGIPKSLNWNQWLGVASMRPFDPDYLPTKWKGYYDFGSGVLGEMGCHMLDAAYWGLELKVPTEIESSTIINNCYPCPVSSVVTYKFPARGNMPPVTYKWYEGGMYPPFHEIFKDDNSRTGNYQFNGSLIFGEKGSILSDLSNNNIQISPNNKFRELSKELHSEKPRHIKENHYKEFFNAIKGYQKASSDFSYAGPLTETVLLGTIAQRTIRKLKYDDSKSTFINNDEANKLLRKDYPKGWILS